MALDLDAIDTLIPVVRAEFSQNNDILLKTRLELEIGEFFSWR